MKKAFTLLTILLCIMIVFPLHVSADTEKEAEEYDILSPGLANIAARCCVRVSAMAGQDILITEENFLMAMNRRSVEKIKISSLPSPALGELTLSGEAVAVGDVIYGYELSKLNFSPAGNHITDACFSFYDSQNGCEYDCEMYLLSEVNTSPVSRIKSIGAYVSTYKNISVSSSLPGYDPDGDEIEFIIVEHPKSGSVILDRTCGDYKYVPDEGFTGSDSFRYVIADKYGAYSLSREVSVSVDSINASEVFADMSMSSAYAQAVSLSREGIMSGTSIGSSLMFLPENELTRGQFVAMLMDCCQIDADKSVLHTKFYDDADIHPSIKGAVAAAYELGYISGKEIDGKLCFLPDDTISRLECAQILNNILRLNTKTIIPVISDIEECPADSFVAVNSLCHVYILPTFKGNVDIELPVTREYAAKLLWNVRTFINLGLSS